MPMIANPARDSARIGLERPSLQGGAAFERAKAPAARLAPLRPTVPSLTAQPSENAENEKKLCRWDRQWFWARRSSGLLTTPPSLRLKRPRRLAKHNAEPS